MHDALLLEMDDVYWFLDHWIIVRKDGTPILNGTPEQFETALRALLKSEERRRNTESWLNYDVWTGEFLDE